jgi:hypothetical protein
MLFPQRGQNGAFGAEIVRRRFSPEVTYIAMRPGECGAAAGSFS